MFRLMRVSDVLRVKNVCLMVVLMLLVGCQADDVSGLVRLKDHEYMPLSLGVYQLYQVEETEYVNGPVGETLRYQLKMEVVDSIAYGNGFYTYIIHRQIRPDASQAWTNKDTWSATFTDREAIVQQGNVSFVKLALPLSLDVAWNGNLYNTLGEEEYVVSIFGQSMSLDADSFQDVLEVTHSNEVDDIVGNDIRKEVYARGVGLIKRTEEVVTYCSNTPSCIGEKIIEQGSTREMVLLEYGKN